MGSIKDSASCALKGTSEIPCLKLQDQRVKKKMIGFNYEFL